MAEAKEGRVYVHYKDSDKRYRVLHTGVLMESDLKPVVIYEQLYSCPEYPWGTRWCRPQESFEGTVNGQDRFRLADY